MPCLQLPFFDEIDDAKSILIAGAGGGFDVFVGLPLYFGLRAAGKRVFLANLSFAEIHVPGVREVSPALAEVTADVEGFYRYFPELFLTRWFRDRGEQVPIYCFDNVGVQPVLDGYRRLVQELDLDTVILVDGGTDSLMRGDEAGLGTPVEDIVSLAAVSRLNLPRKFLLCLGFGIDSYHGVCHAHFLEAVAAITRDGGFLGMWSLTNDMPEVRLYRDAVAATLRLMPDHPSIVSHSILAAIDGQFGDHHNTHRTGNSQLFINALMSLYWCFRLEAVTRRMLYGADLIKTESRHEVLKVIATCRNAHPARPWVDLPM